MQPETVATAENEMPQVQINGSSPNALVNSAAGAAGALAGWAISSLGKQLASGTLQSTRGATIDRPTSAPAANAALASASTPAPTLSRLGSDPFAMPMTPTPSSNSGPTRALTSASKGKGMQLGATKVPTGVSSVPDWAEEAAAELESSTSTNPWGNDDLMDVNADEDDWSASASLWYATPQRTDFTSRCV